MATIGDICMAAAINILSAFFFFVAFAILRLQPFNDRVYFPKWHLKGIRSSPTHAGGYVKKFVNLDCRTYIRFLNWMPAALKMPEPELIDHAGFDSVAYIRIYLLGLKIFVPISVLAFAVLIPVNITGGYLEHCKDLTYSDLDKLSISNIPPGSTRFWAHLTMAYAFTIWTSYVLYKEYKLIASMRLHFLASQNRRPDQFTVLVRNVPPDPDESITEHVEHFFTVTHPHHFLTHQAVYNANKLASVVDKRKSLQNWLDYYENKFVRNSATRPTTKTGFWGLWGKTVDAINYYTSEIDKLLNEESTEREKIIRDPKSIIPAAFVSFKTRYGAAICAQTQQSSNPTIWLTEWAPEPRDVYWPNLAIPFVENSIRRLLMAVLLFVLTFCYMFPIAFVQSLANLESIEKVFPFLKPVIEMPAIKSFVQGFLPGIALKIFLIVLPTIIMTMSKIEGFTSLSSLERRSAGKYYLFILVNVFLGSIITGTAFQNLNVFLHESASEFVVALTCSNPSFMEFPALSAHYSNFNYCSPWSHATADVRERVPATVGVSIPMKATFFITYIMVDGWAGVAAEIIRLKPLIIFHLKNAFLVKTESDREQAMDPGSLDFATAEPRIQLYFLLGLVYSVVTPFFLPFIVIFFGLSYLVFRHQIINVYNQEYESGAAFWPDVQKRVITAMIIAQLLLMGLISTKDASNSTALLLALPVLTIWFHFYCQNRFKPAFVNFALQEAMVKDTLERATEPNLDLKSYLRDAYIHPVFCEEFDRPLAIDAESIIVPTKRNSRMSTEEDSKRGSSSDASAHS